MNPDRLAAAVAQGHEDAVQAWPQEDVDGRSCVHCGDPLGDGYGSGLFVHARGLQRCQSSEVPYGHMGHPEMPCPPGEINPCLGYREGDCTHLATPAPVSPPAGEDVDVSTERVRGAAIGEQNVPVTPEQFDRWLAALSARPVEAQTVRQVAKAHGIQTGDGAEAVDVLTGKRIAPEPVEAEEVAAEDALRAEAWAAEARRERELGNQARAERDAALARAEAAEAVIEKVRALHVSRPNSASAMYPTPLCSCGDEHPCATAAALSARPVEAQEVERLRADRLAIARDREVLLADLAAALARAEAAEDRERALREAADDFESVVDYAHEVYEETDTEPAECTDECPGCAGERLRALLDGDSEGRGEPLRVEWGVVLDETDSTDVYESREQAEAMAVYEGGRCAVVRIETWLHSPAVETGGEGR